jgi:hypothetical protein
MTTRVTVSLPDDVAEQLADLPPRQVSAYVADALRRRAAADSLRAALRAAGHGDFDDDPAASFARRSRPEIPADVVAEVRRHWEAEIGRPIPGNRP